jgi:large subunit ribosomal protein L13
MKTTVIRNEDIKRSWHLIDLKKQTLGRAATQIAQKLIGKSKATFSPHLDQGDYVVCINAADVAVTGNKRQDKLYQHHSMHPGGFKEINFADLMAKDPRKVINHAVKGMLPKNKLRDVRLKRLKIFVDANHPYANQLKQADKEE